jgi:hypothetical protein
MSSFWRDMQRVLSQLAVKINRMHCMLALYLLVVSCGGSQPRQPDLPDQPDKWVNSILLDPDSTLTYIGKTRDFIITSASEARAFQGPKEVSAGDDIEGIQVNAIRCLFLPKDAFYGEQYMWRGRWGCQAGRSRGEIENAVGTNGDKRFDYLSISPVTLAK